MPPPPALTLVLTFILVLLVCVVQVLTIGTGLAGEVAAATSLDVGLDFHGSVPVFVVSGFVLA